MMRILLVFLFSMSFGENESRVPFTGDAWHQLSYSQIKSNRVDFEPDKLIITVESSASPLIYPFDRFMKLNSVRVKGRITEGQINITKSHNQLETESDDFIFRLGVVLEGSKKLSFVQKRFAPKWIRELFKLNKTKTGISHIEFFNIYSDNRIEESSRRQHPSSNLIYENFYAQVSSDGVIEMEIPLGHINQNIVALWLSSDGDETNSSFKIEIRDISIIY